MKRLITLLAICFAAAGIRAQSVGINTAPAASAALDVTSTTKGMLVPRMTTVQRNAIVSPATGLMVYDTDLNAFYYYNGTAWAPVGSGAAGTTSLQLLADKSGGTGESFTGILAGSTTPVTLKFENVAVSPTLGTYAPSTGIYTVGASGAGTYLIQAKLHTLDNSTPSNTVSPYISLVKNNGVYGTLDDNVYYGDYPVLATVLPANLRGQGSLTKIVKLNVGDTFRIVAVSGNSSTASPNVQASASCKLTVEKLN